MYDLCSHRAAGSGCGYSNSDVCVGIFLLKRVMVCGCGKGCLFVVWGGVWKKRWCIGEVLEVIGGMDVSLE